MLQEHYGIDPTTQTHFTGGQEQPGRIERIPLDLDFVKPIAANKTLSQMLYDGEIDALYAARTPSSFLKNDGRVVRLFPNFPEVEKQYYQSTKIFPAMHTVVIRREIYNQHPWIAQNLVTAFTKAKEHSYCDLQETDALKTMLPWLPAHIAETKKEFGDDWWAYGIDSNRHMLEVFCQYHHTQGLSDHVLSIEELFAPETLLNYRL
jgi:4,5-dihydroxyphthalate decarboxylase